jgi:hypothetical protein
MLLFLASNPDIIFSREHIYNQIWGEDMYSDLSTVAPRYRTILSLCLRLHRLYMTFWPAYKAIRRVTAGLYFIS